MGVPCDAAPAAADLSGPGNRRARAGRRSLRPKRRVSGRECRSRATPRYRRPPPGPANGQGSWTRGRSALQKALRAQWSSLEKAAAHRPRIDQVTDDVEGVEIVRPEELAQRARIGRARAEMDIRDPCRAETSRRAYHSERS